MCGHASGVPDTLSINIMSKSSSLHIHLLSDTSEKRTYVCTLIFIIHVHIIFEILTIHTMYVVHADRDSFMYMYLN